MDIDSCYVVLGAYGGIGTSLCRRLHESGANVVAAGRNPDKLRVLAESLGVHTCVVDATSSNQLNECLAEAQQKFGRIEGVANCVGSLLLKPAHLTSDADWQSIIATNLTSAFVTVRSAANAMLPFGGSIVLVSSAAARIGLANHEAIAAAKAGIVGLMLSSAATYSDRDIRVNCVSPGLIRTPLTSKLVASEMSLNASIAMHPLGRIGEPADVASAIAWLLNPDQHWVTGQDIGVDGGLGTLKTKVKM